MITREFNICWLEGWRCVSHLRFASNDNPSGLIFLRCVFLHLKALKLVVKLCWSFVDIFFFDELFSPWAGPLISSLRKMVRWQTPWQNFQNTRIMNFRYLKKQSFFRISDHQPQPQLRRFLLQDIQSLVSGACRDQPWLRRKIFRVPSGTWWDFLEVSNIKTATNSCKTTYVFVKSKFERMTPTSSSKICI